MGASILQLCAPIRELAESNRKFDVVIIVGLMILLAVIVVGFLMYMLTSPNWNSHS